MSSPPSSCSQALRPCWFPPAGLPPALPTHPLTLWGMLGEVIWPPASTPPPKRSSSHPSSLLMVRMAQVPSGALGPLANPQGPAQASASPGYLQAGPVSTALPSFPLGEPPAQPGAAGWGGLRHQRTRRQAWGEKNTNAKLTVSQQTNRGKRSQRFNRNRETLGWLCCGHHKVVGAGRGGIGTGRSSVLSEQVKCEGNFTWRRERTMSFALRHSTNVP